MKNSQLKNFYYHLRKFFIHSAKVLLKKNISWSTQKIEINDDRPVLFWFRVFVKVKINL